MSWRSEPGQGKHSMRGWRRLGVVLSVFWCVGFSWLLWKLERDEAHRQWRASGWEVCTLDAADKRKRLQNEEHAPLDRLELIARIDGEERECHAKAGARYDSALKRTAMPVWSYVVANAISLAVLWLLAWAVVCVGRWVAAGFRQGAG
jgi:hypothetical protein